MTTHKHIHTISVFAFSLILAVLGPAVTASAALLDNLVGYWQYENNYDDSSVSNNDMQVGAGAPTFGTGANAQIGTFALNVDSGEYAETQSNITGLVTGSNARTMNLWFRTDADGTNAIASYGTNTIGQLFETLLLASGLHSAHTSWEGHFWGGGGYETGLGGILPVVTVGQWHMATLAYDGATNVAVYHDGSLAGNFATAGVLNTASSTLQAGNSASGFNNGYDGAIDDLALWNRVLSAGEVQTIHNAGLAGQNLFQAAGSAIPEPSTFALLAVGLLSLGLVSGRRRRGRRTT